MKREMDTTNLLYDIDRLVEDQIFDTEYWHWVETSWLGGTGWKPGREPGPGAYRTVYVRPMVELRHEHDDEECSRNMNERCNCWEAIARSNSDEENYNRCWADEGFLECCPNRGGGLLGLCPMHSYQIVGLDKRMEWLSESSMGYSTPSVWRIPRFSNTN